MNTNLQQTKLCGKCNKPKGKTEGCCKCGRPTKYKKEYIKKIDEYLDIRRDHFEEVYVGKDGDGIDITANKFKVRLPTVGGFAKYIGVNNTTLYEWKSTYEEFSNALEKITEKQKERLIDSGLSGDYNSTIAKLILSSNHGMKEKSDITTDNKPLNEIVDGTSYKEDKEAITKFHDLLKANRIKRSMIKAKEDGEI